MTVREYFYHVDLLGRLFLKETKERNIATCFKDKKFLAFFFRNIKPNNHPSAMYAAEFPWISPCGPREINYVSADETALVYQSLACKNGSHWFLTLQGDQMTAPFHGPLALKGGKIFHRLPSSTEREFRYRYALLRSSIVMDHFASEMDQSSYIFQGERFLFHQIDE